MRRRAFLAVVGGTVAWPLAIAAEERVYRLGFLGPTSAPVPEHQAFFDALATLGYREGENLIVERRFAAGDDSRLPALAADLVHLRVDVIVVQSSTAIRAAKDATTTIPIVMGSTADALGLGLVSSLSHPGGNITGTNFIGSQWTVKHVELLLEVRPGATRLGFLANFSFLPEPAMYEHMRAAAAGHGAEMILYDVRQADDYDATFASMAKGRLEGLAVGPNVFHREHRRELAALAAKYGLPAVYGSRDMVEAGGLISYGVDFRDVWRKAADYVDRIFKGAAPGDLPVQQSIKFELLINLIAAKALGIAIPPTLLARADEVIE